MGRIASEVERYCIAIHYASPFGAVQQDMSRRIVESYGFEYFARPGKPAKEAVVITLFDGSGNILRNEHYALPREEEGLRDRLNEMWNLSLEPDTQRAVSLEKGHQVELKL